MKHQNLPWQEHGFVGSVSCPYSSSSQSLSKSFDIEESLEWTLHTVEGYSQCQRIQPPWYCLRGVEKVRNGKSLVHYIFGLLHWIRLHPGTCRSEAVSETIKRCSLKLYICHKQVVHVVLSLLPKSLEIVWWLCGKTHIATMMSWYRFYCTLPTWGIRSKILPVSHQAGTTEECSFIECLSWKQKYLKIRICFSAVMFSKHTFLVDSLWLNLIVWLFLTSVKR